MKMNKSCWKLMIVAAAVPSAAVAAVEYQIVEVGHLRTGGHYWSRLSVNNAGIVAATSLFEGGHSRGWTWSTGGGHAEMPHGVGFIADSTSTGISQNGWVSGSARIDGTWYGYRYQQGPGYQFLAPLATGQSFGMDVNGAGTVIGFSVENGDTRGTRWNLGGSGAGLPGYGERTVGRALNDAGYAVGYADYNGSARATMFNANGTLFDLQSFLPGAAETSTAFGINDLGFPTVVGEFSAGGVDRGFVYAGGVTVVDAPAGYANAMLQGVNNANTAVGRAWNVGQVTYQATVWSATSGNRNLNDLIAANSGWQLQSAFSINDDGWIVGLGKLNGRESVFLAQPVPEPASLLFLGVGAAALLRRRANR
jgi:hypothetical protein